MNIEYLWFECHTCREEFDILVRQDHPEDLDDCVVESGHKGHEFEICDYEPEHDVCESTPCR